MEGIRGSAFGPAVHRLRAAFAIGLVAIFVAISASADDFVTPGTNTNVIGLTPNLDHIPDFGLKQQQEPSCIIRPSNNSFIFCAYNDMRASDQPNIHGDSWMGVSMSNDSGQTWFSRLAPGYKGDLANNINMGFAADPSVVAIPGNSPGLAVLNYIGGFRDSNNGVLAIQRWVEFPQEDVNFWLPERGVRFAADGSSGRFIDKPAFLYVPDAITNQGIITQDIFVEGQIDPISVTTPTGTLFVAYAVFTGSQSVKVLLQYSRDNGITWSHIIRMSEDQNEVTGVSLTSLGQDVVAIWRRKADGNNSDAIMSAHCGRGGTKCTKAKVVFDVCPFDQPATGASFRSFTFPWGASDGNRVYALATDRRFAGDASCTLLGAPAPGGTYSGIPRIVGMSSVDGKTWVGSEADKTLPFVVDDQPAGYQVMPAAIGTKGRIDLAWYDTRREEPLLDGNTLPDGTPLPLINDYLAVGARVFRKADVYMTRMNANGCASSPQAGCTPDIEPSVRVSQYSFQLNDVINNGELEQVGQETEAHLPNLRLYASGTLAFKGDYIAIATAATRKIASGQWIPNQEPEGARGPELSGYVNREDILVAWGDNRDVVADFIVDPSSAGQLPYTPTTNASSWKRKRNKPITDPEGESGSTYLVDVDAGDSGNDGSMKVVSEPDDDPQLPSDSDPANVGVCGPANDFSRSRNGNVYSSMVLDEASLSASITNKPLNTVQRMFPIQMNNPDQVNPRNFCLVIDWDANQSNTDRASFFQLPAIPPFNNSVTPPLTRLDVEVPPWSSVSRGVFVVTGDISAIIPVNAYDGICADFPGTELVSSVQLGHGSLFDPEFCALPIPPERVDACLAVSSNETHNITLVSPNLQAPILQAPILQAPNFQAPILQAPILQAPNFQAPILQAPNLQAPILQAPILQANQLLAPNLQAPNFQAPNFQAPNLQAAVIDGDAATVAVYQDVTFVVSADANVTTTYSADIAVSGLDSDETHVQLIAWTPNVSATSIGCESVTTIDNQVISTVGLSAPNMQALNLPSTISADEQEPYAGTISFTGTPGRDIAITARIWSTGISAATLADLFDDFVDCHADNPGNPENCENAGVAQLMTFGASAQGCSTNALPLPGDDPFDCLNTGVEKILQDRLGPNIAHPADFTTEATGPGGETVDYLVTVTDNTDPNPVFSCAPASGSLFGLGANTVMCDANDNLGNTSMSSFTITVADTNAPSLSALPDITEEANSSSGANVSWLLPTASDIVDLSPVVACIPAINSVFGFGPTTVSCTATDSSTNETEITFVVTVEDTVAPMINLATVPGDITVDANVSTGWTLSPPTLALWSPEVSATDDVDGTFNAACTHSSGGDFPLGATTVSCDATDAHNNMSDPVTFGVTVVDQTAPTISLPADVTVLARDTSDIDVTYVVDSGSSSVTVEANLPDPDGARITYSVPANDIVDANAVVTCLPAPGSVFAVGTTPISCTASDGTNTSDPLLFSITVEDTTEPEFSVMNGVTFSFSADTPGGAYVDLVGDPAIDLHATDRGARIDPECSATPTGGGTAILLPAILAPGDYDVSCVVDDVTTMAMLTVVVDVVDSVPPVLNVPLTAVTQDADASGSAIVDFSTLVTASDVVDTDVEISCSPASGTAFAVGSHTVTCTANDHVPGSPDDPNVTTASFTVVVSDVTAPAPPMGPDLTEEATGAAGAAVSWLPITSVDAVDGVVTAICIPASGSTFALGTTAVACTATDAAANFSVGGFAVTVEDTTAPDLPALSDIMEEATGPAGAIVTWPQPVATDLVDPAPAVTCLPSSGSTFALGTTPVSCTATDGSNTSGASLFDVTVVDTTAPVVSAANIEVGTLGAPVNVEINYVADVVVTDAVDASPALVCSIDNPGPDATDNGTTVVITNFGSWVANCSATDSSGNAGNTSFNITVSFPYAIEIDRLKGRINAGSTAPVDFRYLSGGSPVNSAAVVPVASWVGPYNNSACSTGNTNAGNGEDSGSSGYRYSHPDWRFNWQTPLEAGYYMFTISPPGLADADATICVRLR